MAALATGTGRSARLARYKWEAKRSPDRHQTSRLPHVPLKLAVWGGSGGPIVTIRGDDGRRSLSARAHRTA
jgi:hypothetical protein